MWLLCSWVRYKTKKSFHRKSTSLFFCTHLHSMSLKVAKLWAAFSFELRCRDKVVNKDYHMAFLCSSPTKSTMIPLIHQPQRPPDVRRRASYYSLFCSTAAILHSAATILHNETFLCSLCRSISLRNRNLPDSKGFQTWNGWKLPRKWKF